MSWSLAVDLGTTNTAAAVRFGDSTPVELRLGASSGGLPSAVFLSGASVYVGEAAWDHVDEDPVAFYPSPKRLLMRTPVSQLDALVPVFAALYREVYRRALGECGPDTPDTVVLTHPEALSERARTMLVAAAVEAGIDRDSIELISEPVAAAAHYSRHADVPERLLIVDVGGGTCDVALLGFDSSGAPRVLAAEGDNSLGGRTFDGRFATAVAARRDGGTPEPETLRTLGEAHRHRAIEKARVALSTQETCTVTLGPELGELSWAREDFEDLICGDVTRIAELAHRVLASGGPGAPHGAPVSICLTGGTVLTPAVQRAVQRIGTLGPVENPFAAVCLGAVTVGTANRVQRENSQQTELRERQSPLRTTRRALVVLGAVLVVVALVCGLVLVNRGGHSDGADTGTAGDAAMDGKATDFSDFDPSPVVPVTLAEDSPVFSSGSLDCSGVMESAAQVAKKTYGDHERPVRTGVHGNTSCDLGTDLMFMLTVETFRPNGFSPFSAYRRNASAASSPVALDGDLVGWYRFDGTDMDTYYDTALFVDGYGWIAVSVTDEDAGTTDIGLEIARAVDPVLKVRDRGTT